MLSGFKKFSAFILAAMIIAFSVVSVFAQINCMITHQPTVQEPYIAVTSAYSASFQWYEIQSDGTEKPIEGQSGNRLTVTPDGKNYFCRISWADGTEKQSDIITNDYIITHQPSAEEPYILLNNHSEAHFQWYKINHEAKKLVIENPAEDEIAVSHFWSGNFADGVWSGDSTVSVDIEFELKKNQILTVTPNVGFTGTVENYGESYLTERSGIYSYTATDDMSFNLCIEDSVPFTAEIKIITFTSFIPVDGQTGTVFTADADGNYYFCKMSGNNGAELSTLVFRADLAIKHQPSAKEPYVEINTSENATYSWYEVIEKTYKITDRVASESELPLSQLWIGSFSSGKWHSNQSGTFEAVLNIRKGQTVAIDLPFNFIGGIGGLRKENGTYLYTAVTNEKFYIYLKNPEPFAFDIHIREFENKETSPISTQNTLGFPVDGKYYRCEVATDETVIVSETFRNTYALTHQPTEDESYVETCGGDISYQWYKVSKKLYTVVDGITAESQLNAEHVYSGTYSDSAWASDKGKIDIELNLKKDDVLIVSPSDGFDGSVSEYDGSNLSVFEGMHTFVAKEDGMFDLYIFSRNTSSSFSAVIQVLRGSKGTLVEGQTDSQFLPVSGGEYMCAVVFEDGTVLDSDTVSISEGALERLETKLESFSEDTVNEDNLADITDIVRTANELTPSDTDEAERISSVIAKSSALIGIINETINLVTCLSTAVEAYDINKVIPSDMDTLIELRADIAELQNSTNLSVSQTNKLSELLEKCNALIQKADTLNITVSIVNNPSETEIRYGETIVLTAVATDMPLGAKTVWFVNDSAVSEGEKFEFTPEESSFVTVKITDENGEIICDKNGNEISDSEQINVRSNFFIKIINFFKKLFRISQTIVQVII